MASENWLYFTDFGENIIARMGTSVVEDLIFHAVD